MGSTSFPLVTIITPTYNRAYYLNFTIQSILGQDYPNIEYIVLDDGSTDNTAQMITKYKEQLVYLAHPNMGETRTVNKGLSIAKGDIICVVNSDDLLLPGAVKTIVTVLMDHPNLIGAYPDWNIIDKNGDVIKNITTKEYRYVDMIRWHYCIPGPATFFRREIVEITKGRDVDFVYVADFDFWLRAGLCGNFKRVPEILASFRSHKEGATSHARGTKMAEEQLRLVEKIYTLPNLPQEVIQCKHEAFSSAYYIAGFVSENDLKTKRLNYLKAVALAPHKYLSEYKDRLRGIISVFIPDWIKQPIRKVVALFQTPT